MRPSSVSMFLCLFWLVCICSHCDVSKYSLFTCHLSVDTAGTAAALWWSEWDWLHRTKRDQTQPERVSGMTVKKGTGYRVRGGSPFKINFQSQQNWKGTLNTQHSPTSDVRRERTACSHLEHRLKKLIMSDSCPSSRRALSTVVMKLCVLLSPWIHHMIDY